MKTSVVLLVAVTLVLASDGDGAGLFDRLVAMVDESQAVPISDTGETDYEVVELFRAESPEELEAALTDGYPPAWLEEVLSDTTIPEEDRYWLDCRVRSHIARHLHRFYGRDGEPVEVEAEWISPGEHYWQEHLMVNPVGEDYGFGETPDHLPDFTGEPGTIRNLYGELTGELALTQRGIRLSRDGSLGVLKTGPGGVFHPLAPNYVCLLYSDGTFKEIEVDYIDDWAFVNVSQDGELIIACTTDPRIDVANGRALLFDRDGNLLHSTEIGGMPHGRPIISPDCRLIAIPMYSSIVILDAATGELLRRFPDLWVREVAFPISGERLAHAGNINGIAIAELSEDTGSWAFSELLDAASGNYVGVSVCNDVGLTAVNYKLGRVDEPGRPPFRYFGLLLNDGVELYGADGSNLDLSPGGSFAIGFNSRRAYPSDYEPSLITVLSIRKRG